MFAYIDTLLKWCVDKFSIFANSIYFNNTFKKIVFVYMTNIDPSLGLKEVREWLIGMFIIYSWTYMDFKYICMDFIAAVKWLKYY